MGKPRKRRRSKSTSPQPKKTNISQDTSSRSNTSSTSGPQSGTTHTAVHSPTEPSIQSDLAGQSAPCFTGVPLKTSNRFGVFANQNDNTNDDTNDQIHPKPPPIYVKNVASFPVFIKSLKDILGNDGFTCKARSSDVAVQCKNPEGYRQAVSSLRSENVTFHTYQPKEDKPYRIVLRHLHSTTPTECIKTELEALGFQVRNVTNVRKGSTPLSLFFVDLEPNTNNKDIFNITSIYHCRVKVEEPYKRVAVVQCTRCQLLGHTKTYCNLTPRCVKCAATHLTSECAKTPEQDPKCVLCPGSHPANYRGCIVHKELQKKLRKPLQGLQHSSNTAANSGIQQRQPTHTSNHPNNSPSPISQETSNQDLTVNPSNDPTNMSYATVAAAVPPKPRLPAFIPPPSTHDFTSNFQTFLNELRLTLEPLFTALTTLTTFLNTLLPARLAT